MLDKLVQLYDDNVRADRFRAMEMLAREYQLNYNKRELFGHLPTAVQNFEVFSGKGKKRLLGIVADKPVEFSGTLRAYDYVVTKDLQTTAQTILEITHADLCMPYCRIEPKGMFLKMRDLLVVQHNFYPELKEFHRKYKVSTHEGIPPERAVNAGSLDLLGRHDDLTVEFDEEYILLYRENKELKPREIMELMDFAEVFAGGLNTGTSEEGFL